MKAWRYHPDRGFGAVNLPDEACGEAEVRVEVEAAVVSQRDLETIDKTPEGIPGRAAVGRVVEAGAAGKDWIGARVVVGPYQACGECDLCRRATVDLCQQGTVFAGNIPGTLRSHIVARARWLCHADGELAVAGAAAAVTAGPAGQAYSAYCRAGIGPGEPLVIVGQSSVARLLEQVAHARGAHPMRTNVDAAPNTVASRLRTLQDIHGLIGQTVTLFETTGSEKGRSLATSLAKAGDIIVLAEEDPTDDDSAMSEGAGFEKTLTLLSIRAPHPDLYPEVIAMARRTEIDIEGAADVLSLADLSQVPDRARRGQASGRVPVVTLA